MALIIENIPSMHVVAEGIPEEKDLEEAIDGIGTCADWFDNELVSRMRAFIKHLPSTWLEQRWRYLLFKNDDGNTILLFSLLDKNVGEACAVVEQGNEEVKND